MATEGHIQKPFTLDDVINKLDKAEKKAELRDRRTVWLVLMAAAAGVVSGSAILHAWVTVGIGMIFVIIGFCGVAFYWKP